MSTDEKRGVRGWRGVVALLLTLGLVLGLLGSAGCAYDPTVDQYYYMNIAAEPLTLDPQTATDTGSLTVIGNCFEGLLHRGAAGELTPAVARRYEISSDGLTYTFYLRRDAAWRTWDDTTLRVTAHDFVFAFRRLFDPSTASGSSDAFLCIENSSAVLAGEQSVYTLGVTATDDYTLTFRLEAPNVDFLYLLTTAAAMPCSETFFNSTGGRYGLEAGALLCNGPFYVSGWEHDHRVITRRSLTYYNAAAVLPAGVSYYVDDEDNWLYSFRTGETDFVSVSGLDAAGLAEDGYTTYELHNTTWVLVFNLRNEVLANERIRTALAKSLDRSALRSVLPADMEDAQAIVPRDVGLGGVNYRSSAGSELALSFEIGAAQQLMAQGLEELELTSLPAYTMLVPNSGSQGLLASAFQTVWQSDLLAFINIETLSEETISARISSGNWDMAVVALTAEYDDPAAVLRMFIGDGAGDFPGYKSTSYRLLLDTAASTADRDAAMVLYRQAEKLLINQAVTVPLYYEKTACALGRTVSGVEVSPFGGRLYFAYARKR